MKTKPKKNFFCIITLLHPSEPKTTNFLIFRDLGSNLRIVANWQHWDEMAKISNFHDLLYKHKRRHFI